LEQWYHHLTIEFLTKFEEMELLQEARHVMTEEQLVEMVVKMTEQLLKLVGVVLEEVRLLKAHVVQYVEMEEN
jgi:hypothetical protein